MISTSAHVSTTGESGRLADVADILVEPGWLDEHLQDPSLRVIEVDVTRKAYDAGHITGSLFWNPYTDMKRADYRPVDADAIRALLERSGIAPEDTVVFYGYAPSLAFWLLKSYRHRDVRILNAARTVWQAEDRPWTTAPAPPAEPTRYPLPDQDRELRAGLDEVLEAARNPRTTILDVRSAAEFSGERFWPSGAPEPNGRAGHVPGAVNIDAAAVFDDNGRFLDVPALESLFAPVDPGSDVITYCTIGNRASAMWFALRYLLGHRSARVYDGSWAEWGHSHTTPVAEG
jgi:thiosulfate/3-mercaptopyruvate sulfurtransferase